MTVCKRKICVGCLPLDAIPELDQSGGRKSFVLQSGGVVFAAQELAGVLHDMKNFSIDGAEKSE